MIKKLLILLSIIFIFNSCQTMLKIADITASRIIDNITTKQNKEKTKNEQNDINEIIKIIETIQTNENQNNIYINEKLREIKINLQGEKKMETELITAITSAITALYVLVKTIYATVKKVKKN